MFKAVLVPAAFLSFLLGYLCAGVGAFSSAPPVRFHRGVKAPEKVILTHFDVKSDGQQLDAEKRINFKVDLDSPKVVTNESIGSGEKKVFCRCWLSGTFPHCDGAHVKHNAAMNDNVGPLIISVPRSERKTKPTPLIKSSTKKIVEGRKLRILWGYRATALAYLLYAWRYFSVKGIQQFSIHVTSGYVLTAGLAYILASAVQGNRLSSDTYKRLNLSLLHLGIMGIVGWGLVKLGDTVPGFTPMFIPPLFAMINGIKGYGYGVLGYDKSGNTALLTDFSTGVKSTIGGILSLPKSAKSTGYLAATYMVTTMKAAKLLEVFRLILEGADGLTVFTRLSRYARYSMLSTVLYTLKDAADRGRLEGTTFIELNFLSAAVLAAMATYSGMTSPIGGSSATFALFSAWNGIFSIYKKRSS